MISIRGILFDKDGTLIDFQTTWAPLYREASRVVADNNVQRARHMLHASGYDETTHKILSNSVLAQGNNDEIAEIWARYAPQMAGSVDDISRRMGEIFAAGIANHATEVTNLKVLFGNLKRKNLKFGVATSDGIESAKKSLEPFGIIDQLDFFAGFDSGFGVKPGPGMVEGFAAVTGLDAAEIMMVGDSPHDMEMGRVAGVGMNIGVLTGVSDYEHLCKDADHIIETIGDIEILLDA